MIAIDKGEKHLFRRRLLASNDTVISWDDVDNITFEFLEEARTVVETWSKSAGTITKDGEYVEFEIDSTDLRAGEYYLRGTIVVNDSRWDDGKSKEITWEDDYSKVYELPTGFNSSSSEGDIKFDVVVETAIEPPTDIPTQAAFSTSHTTDTTASLPYTSVSNASRYDVQIESTGAVIDNGSSTTVNLSDLTPNTTDRWRVRAANSAGETDYSPYQSFTTNPATTPSVSPSVNRDVVTFTIPNPLGLDVEINNGSWVNEGNVTQIIVSGLAEGSSLSSLFRFRNAGGPGPETTVSYQTTERPQSAPTITATDPYNGGNTVNINLISGIDSVEYRLDAGTPVDVGLTSQFNATATEKTYNLEVRYTNEWGGGDWSDVKVVSILENTPPTVSNPLLTPTVSGDLVTVAYQKATDNKNDADLKYFLVEGSSQELTDKDLITGLTRLSSGTDVAQLQFNGNYGIGYDVNVYTEDLAGNISLYTPIFVDVPNPEVQSIEVFDGAVNVINGIELNSGQVLDLDVILTVIDSENANYTTSIDNTSLVTIDANDVLTASNNSGDAILTITADLDGTQLQVPITVFAEELANDSTLIEVTA